MAEVSDNIRMQAAARGLTLTDSGEWADKDGNLFYAAQDEAQALLGSSKVQPMVAFVPVSGSHPIAQGINHRQVAATLAADPDAPVVVMGHGPITAALLKEIGEAGTDGRYEHLFKNPSIADKPLFLASERELGFFATRMFEAGMVVADVKAFLCQVVEKIVVSAAADHFSQGHDDNPS